MESHHLRYPINPHKPLRRRRLLPILLILLILLPGSSYVYAASHKPLANLSPRVKDLSKVGGENITLSWPSQGQAAIGTYEEGVLAQSQLTETPAPTASIAKVITALAVLEKKPITVGATGPTLTLDQTDVDFYNYYISVSGSNVPVEFAEQITELQALEAMMLPSANNMADTLAYWAFGSLDAYVVYANELVKQWGLPNTKIADASGLSADTKSTPSELVKIGQRALKNPVLSAIIAKEQTTIPVAGIITNTNILLGTDDVIGIKTGHTYEAGGCLLFAATYSIAAGHSTTIIGAVQGATGPAASFLASKGLLASAKKGFGPITVVKAGTEVASYTSEWGGRANVVALDNLTGYGWTGIKYEAQTKLNEQKAPLITRQKTGSITTKIAGKNYTSDLIIKNTLESPSLLWRLTHYF